MSFTNVLRLIAVMSCCYAVSAFAQAPSQSQQPSESPAAVVPQTPASPAPAPAPGVPTQQRNVPGTILLSMVIPGGGNFYTGQPLKGGIVFAGSIAGWVIAAKSFTPITCTGAYHLYSCTGSSSSTAQLTGGLVMGFGFYVYGIVSAARRADAINNHKVTVLDRLRLSFPGDRKKPGVALAYNYSF